MPGPQGPTGSFNQSTGSFTALSISSLTAATGSISTLLGGTGSFVQLSATSAGVSSLVAATGSISTLLAGTGSFVLFSASSLAAATGSISTLLGGTGSFVTLAAPSASFSSLAAATGSISTLIAGTGSFATRLTATQLSAGTGSFTTLLAATGLFSNLSASTGGFTNNLSVGGALTAGSLQSYTVSAPGGLQGAYFSYPLSNDAGVYAYANYRVHSGSTQGQQTNSLVVGPSSVQLNLPVMTQRNTLDDGSGNVTVQGSLSSASAAFPSLAATAASVSSLSAATGSITTLLAGTGSFVQLSTTAASVSSLAAATGNISTLLAGTGSFVQLSTTSASLSSLAAATGSISTLLAGTGSFVQLSATAASASLLSAMTGMFSSGVSAARLTATTLTAGTGSVLTSMLVGSTGTLTSSSTLLAQNSAWRWTATGSALTAPNSSNTLSLTTDTGRSVFSAQQSGGIRAGQFLLDDGIGGNAMNYGTLGVAQFASPYGRLFQVNSNSSVLTASQTLDDGSGNATFAGVLVAGALSAQTGTFTGKVQFASSGTGSSIQADNYGGLSLSSQISSSTILSLVPVVPQAGFYFSDAAVGDAAVHLTSGAGAVLRFGSASGGGASALRVGATQVKTLNCTLDDGSGNATVLGRITAASAALSNTTISPGGTGASTLTLPTVSGIVGLSPNYIAFAHSSTGFSIASNILSYATPAYLGASGCSYSGAYISLPATACLYQVLLCLTVSVSASSTGTCTLTGQGNSVRLGPLSASVVNTSASAQNLTLVYVGLVDNSAGGVNTFYFATANLSAPVGGSLSFRQVA